MAWYKQNISLTTDTSVSGQAVSVPSKTRFKPKSTFCPIVQNATRNTFANKVNFDVENLFKDKIDPNQTQRNLSKTEQDAVESLSKNEQIVVKKKQTKVVLQ